MPTQFWRDCLLTATYLINQRPTPILDWKSPSKILFRVVLDYRSLRAYVSFCFTYNMDRSQDTFNSRAKRLCFVGYPFGQKGDRVYDLETRKYFVTRDFVFNLESPFKPAYVIPSFDKSNKFLHIISFDTFSNYPINNTESYNSSITTNSSSISSNNILYSHSSA